MARAPPPLLPALSALLARRTPAMADRECRSLPHVELPLVRCRDEGRGSAVRRWGEQRGSASCILPRIIRKPRATVPRKKPPAQQ